MITRLYDNDVYTGEGNPPSNLNPSKLGSIYVNRITGQRWFCKDITTNRNQWVPSAEGFGSYHYYGMNCFAQFHNMGSFDLATATIQTRPPLFFRPSIVYRNKSSFPLILTFNYLGGCDYADLYIGDNIHSLENLPNLQNFRNGVRETTGEFWVNTINLLGKFVTGGSSTTLPTVHLAYDPPLNQYVPMGQITYTIPPNHYYCLELGPISYDPPFNTHDTAMKKMWRHNKNNYRNQLLLPGFIFFLQGNIDYNKWDELGPNAYYVYLNKLWMYKEYNYYDNSGTDREGNNQTYRLAGLE